jgi:hypothetical protein
MRDGFRDAFGCASERGVEEDECRLVVVPSGNFVEHTQER